MEGLSSDAPAVLFVFQSTNTDYKYIYYNIII